VTEQQPEQPQAPTFTTGFEFLNHHLNAAMRYIERATPKQDEHIGPNTAFKLASQHTELARVGALAAIAQQLQQHGTLVAGPLADLVGAVARIGTQMQEARAADQEPAEDLVGAWTYPEDTVLSDIEYTRPEGDEKG